MKPEARLLRVPLEGGVAEMLAGWAAYEYSFLLRGDKTLDETAELIQNRASLYISEQK
ncbi:MAG: hypothetical protein HDT15_08760 [Oscillibacter sp.]|nr:hypothetical protein [Oscillibacter sp.]